MTRHTSIAATSPGSKSLISKAFRLAEEVAPLLLPLYLRVYALGQFSFWSTGLIVTLFGINIGWINKFARWNGHFGVDATGAMFCIVYMVWSVYMWRSARDPMGNRLLISFTIAANLAHYALMMVMVFTMEGEMHHAYMDVLLLGAATLPLAVLFWLANRRQAATTSSARAKT